MKCLVEVYDSKNISLQEVEGDSLNTVRRIARNKHILEYNYKYRSLEDIPREIYTDIVEVFDKS